MKFTRIAVAAALLSSTAMAFAQTPTPAEAPAPAEANAPTATSAPTDTAVQAQPIVAPAAEPKQIEALLPAGTPVVISVNHELHSSRIREGDSFPITVAQDVRLGEFVVIPRGTRGRGEVTWRTGKGVFGKSAKMEIALRYVELDGHRIPLEGGHRQEGEGNTGATVGAVVAAGVIGGLIVTGRSAIVSEGREFTARTVDAVPLIAPETATNGFSTPVAKIAASYVPSAVQTGQTAVEEREREQTREERCREEGRRRAPYHPGVASDYERQCLRRSR